MTLENCNIKMCEFTHSLTNYVKMGVYYRIRSRNTGNEKLFSYAGKKMYLYKLYSAAAQCEISVKRVCRNDMPKSNNFHVFKPFLRKACINSRWKTSNQSKDWRITKRGKPYTVLSCLGIFTFCTCCKILICLVCFVASFKFCVTVVGWPCVLL